MSPEGVIADHLKGRIIPFNLNGMIYSAKIEKLTIEIEIQYISTAFPFVATNGWAATIWEAGVVRVFPCEGVVDILPDECPAYWDENNHCPFYDNGAPCPVSYEKESCDWAHSCSSPRRTEIQNIKKIICELILSGEDGMSHKQQWPPAAFLFCKSLWDLGLPQRILL